MSRRILLSRSACDKAIGNIVRDLLANGASVEDVSGALAKALFEVKANEYRTSDTSARGKS